MVNIFKFGLQYLSFLDLKKITEYLIIFPTKCLARNTQESKIIYKVPVSFILSQSGYIMHENFTIIWILDQLGKSLLSRIVHSLFDFAE